MSEYLFVFGRSADLATSELLSFYPESQQIRPEIAIIEADINPIDFISRLGGTVKIAQVIKRTTELTAEEIGAILESDGNRITFGISTHGDIKVERKFLGRIKDWLGQKGISGRFVEAKDGKELSSVVVDKEKLTELVVVKTREGIIIGKTLAVQQFEEWGKRDFGRPWADARSGMLPPKVARMVVNLGISNVKFQMSNEKKHVLMDPFCGMGTILGEALLAGYNVVGSDLDAKAVEKARDNIKWLISVSPEIKGANTDFFVCDATHVSEKLEVNSIDVIVTEPFMGPANGGNDQFPISNFQLKNIKRGLEKLYIGCLRDWHKVLKPGGRVVMALPKWVWNKREYFVKKVIDSCEKLGYTVTTGPVEYSRPQAVVRREFYVFEKI